MNPLLLIKPFISTTGQQQIIKILPNSSGQQLKAISKHALRTADTKVVAQVIDTRIITHNTYLLIQSKIIFATLTGCELRIFSCLNIRFKKSLFMIIFAKYYVMTVTARSGHVFNNGCKSYCIFNSNSNRNQSNASTNGKDIILFLYVFNYWNSQFFQCYWPIFLWHSFLIKFVAFLNECNCRRP